MAPTSTPPASDGTQRDLLSLPGLAVAVGAITILRLLYLTVFPFDLHPDEAQYWSWSRSFEWGYFSKPPMVAWLIGLATALCGPGEACIKAASPILHAATAFFVYGAAHRLYGLRAGVLAGLVFLTLPGVSFSATIMSTDPPLLTCWAAAFYILVRLRDGVERPYPWWLALGIAVGVGLLSKYAMVFFILGLVLWLALDADARGRLVGGGPGRNGLAMAAAVAALIVLPNLIWNASSGFVTFAHTAANANLGGELLRPEKLADFLGAQFGVFGPILFAALAWLVLRCDRWSREPRARMLAAFVLCVLLPITVVSLLSRAHANWAATAYVAGAIWVAGALDGRIGRAAIWASVALHVAAAAVGFASSIGHTEPGRYGGVAVPAYLDPYMHYRGWRVVGERLSAIRTQYPGVPLLGHDRMTVASALYYVRPRPVEIYAWHHPDDPITNHFRMTRPWPDRTGGEALLISRKDDVDSILAGFRRHRLVARFSVPVATDVRRDVRVFHVSGFLGYKRGQP
ncbi:MAG: glycosyltransferase family 39 protein [Alphaproteobacteria bacterium]|nr:glycosyltransferase family 39 protein [Alphaproteobacteria bacterium]